METIFEIGKFYSDIVKKSDNRRKNNLEILYKQLDENTKQYNKELYEQLKNTDNDFECKKRLYDQRMTILNLQRKDFDNRYIMSDVIVWENVYMQRDIEDNRISTLYNRCLEEYTFKKYQITMYYRNCIEKSKKTFKTFETTQEEIDDGTARKLAFIFVIQSRCPGVEQFIKNKTYFNKYEVVMTQELL